GLGYDWAIDQTAKCIKELTRLARPVVGANVHARRLFDDPGNVTSVTATCASAENPKHNNDRSVDAGVMDPPSGKNAEYAELSDFFYVWLKRTAGAVFPELFRLRVTDKDNEAVANLARFADQDGRETLAKRDYQTKMASIFKECNRVLKPDGILTVMITHKE